MDENIDNNFTIGVGDEQSMLQEQFNNSTASCVTLTFVAAQPETPTTQED